MEDKDAIKKNSLEKFIDLWNMQYDKHIGKFQDKPILKIVLDCITFVVVGGLGLIILSLIWAFLSYVFSWFHIQYGTAIALLLLIALVLIFVLATIIKKFKSKKNNKEEGKDEK